MRGDNGKQHIATLYNVILAPDLCNRLFCIIKLMNLGDTCLFHKGFCTVFFNYNEQNAVILPQSAQRKHALMVKTNKKSKSQKQITKKKVYLGLFHQALGHISTRSIRTGYTSNVWQDIELRINPDPFCTSCQISTMNKKSRSKKPLKPKSPFK